MCYFHLKYNIRKRKLMLGDHYYRVLKHITSLHNSKSKLEFQEKYKLIKEKWIKLKLEKFIVYFEKQWINSPFKNWQLFSTPVGFATANNPVEQYNCIIKKFFTERIKLNVVEMLKCFVKVIQYESSKIVNYRYQETKLVTSKITN